MSMIDEGFQHWLLAQEVEYLDFLHFIYELCHQNANGPVAINVTIVQEPTKPTKHRPKPISWAELKQFEKYLSTQSNGIEE